MTVARLTASVGGIGFLPRAPGTWGSAAAALAGAGILAVADQRALAAASVLAIVAGLWAIPRAGGDADPGWVVIDEVAGMWLAMLPLSRPSLWGVLAAFALFRLLDITKPGPIGRLDRIPGRVGVMSDDVAAGLAAALVLWLVQQAMPWSP
jgi:phosphatidylglycerophosphatase A